MIARFRKRHRLEDTRGARTESEDSCTARNPLTPGPSKDKPDTDLEDPLNAPYTPEPNPNPLNRPFREEEGYH